MLEKHLVRRSFYYASALLGVGGPQGSPLRSAPRFDPRVCLPARDGHYSDSLPATFGLGDSPKTDTLEGR